MREKCVNCFHENNSSYLFPCSECVRLENGGCDMYVATMKSVIKDSGARREFETGAVRDIQEGKGRCDLMPLDVIAEFFTLNGAKNQVIDEIYQFQQTEEYENLILALDAFNEQHWKNNKTMILEVSQHFEEGAKKYGENNWQKGLPVNCYIDSAVQHYLKWLRGDVDERHDRAFVWNILCCIWTVKHIKEGNKE